jgi:hypothetical protein
MTITQFIADLCLNEIERRGELTYIPTSMKDAGDPMPYLAPIVPYHSDYFVETVLTRRD